MTNRIGCPKGGAECGELGYRWSIDLEEGMRSLIEWRRETAIHWNESTWRWAE